MAKMEVDKNGFFKCDGKGYCGGTNFSSREKIMDCFCCKDCDSYIKNGLKINNELESTKLTKWFGGN